MNKKIISVVVIVVVVVAIAGIWIIKNNQKNEEKQENVSQNIEQNPDFKFNVTSEIDIEKLKSYGIPIIIDFGSDSCIPCKQMEPSLKSLNSELQEKAIVRFVDVWKYQNLASDYPIQMIPTQIFIDSKGNPYTPTDTDKYELGFIKDKEGNHVFTTHVGPLTKAEMLDILKEMGMNE